MCPDIHTQEWIILSTTKVEKENPFFSPFQPLLWAQHKEAGQVYPLCVVCSSTGLMMLSTAVPKANCTSLVWDAERKKTSKTIPVLLLARGCAGRHRPLPGFGTFCFLFPSLPFFFPPGSFPLPLHKHTHPGFSNEMWRVFTGTKGAGIESWEEIWKLPFAKCL